MTTTPVDRYQDLLSRRARQGPRPPQGGGGGPAFRFGGGLPDPGSFPYQDLVQAMSDVMEIEGKEALTYGAPYGYDALRDLVVHKYRILEGLELTRDNILIANGSNDALGLVIQAFVDEGDPIISDAPVYMATLQTMRRVGAEVIGVEIDDQGIRPDLVRARLEELRRAGRQCKLIYTIATFQNPTGVTLPEARRRELLALAREYNVMILEDDAYGELRYEGEPVPSLFQLDEAGLVCRTGTVSKILGAGMRVGWVVAPPELIGYISAFNFGGGVSPLTSRLCTFYLREHLEPHVQELIDIYRDKRDAMLDELERGLGDTDASWTRPEGGFFLWVKLPSGTDPKRTAELATEAGVQYIPGPALMPDGSGDEYIRLAFSYESLDGIREGTRRLCDAIKAAGPGRG